MSGCSGVSDVDSRSSELYKSIELTGEWFLNNQNESFLEYEYYPFEKEYSGENHPLREIASLWAIGHLGNFLDDARYDDLARKGFRYFENTFTKEPENGFLTVEVDPGNTKLGYSAFAILSLLEIDDYVQKDYYLEKLAEGIQFQQKDTGEFMNFFFSDKNSGADFYPGEALLALMTLYEYNGDVSLVETAQRAFPFYRDYWRDNKNTAFVPWHTQAYVKLHAATDDLERAEELADFVFEMSDYMLAKHTNKETDQQACEGYYFTRGVVTSVYLEGLNRAYELAEKVGDMERVECYGNFIREGIDAVIALQFTKENDFGKPNHEEAAIGGFLGTLNGDSMRVDRNQHSAFALIGAYELGLNE